MDPLERYRRHLRSYGIAEPGERLARLDFPGRGGLRAFAYQDGGRLRFRAIATADGLVRPGWHPEDDWHGLLREAGDGATVAERVAWLEEEEPLPGALPAAAWRVLGPGAAAAADVDPALLGLLEAPALAADGGGLRWRAFFLPPGGPPLDCTVVARAGAPAEIFREPLVFGEEPEAAAGRVRRLLAAGSAGEKEWALGQLAATRDLSAWPQVAALLAAPREPGRLRLQAAGALADSADPAAIPALAAALRRDPDPAVRRGCAQGLGRLGGQERAGDRAGDRAGERAAGALALAWRAEPDPLVRAEIVHALAAIGGPAARAALAAIAAGEGDEALAELAAFYCETYEERGPSS